MDSASMDERFLLTDGKKDYPSESCSSVLAQYGKAMMTGIGMGIDSYELFAINVVFLMLNDLYPATGAQIPLVAASVVVGALLGQLFFGALADRVNRKKAFLSTLTLVIIGSAASALLSFNVGALSVYTCLTVWRFLLGFGVGGEYPLSATVSREASDSNTGRGAAARADKRASAMLAATFSMQGVGNLLAPGVVLIMLAITSDLNYVWRVSLGIGAAFAMPAYITRCRMPSTFTAAPSSQYFQTLKSNWRKLIGTAGSWFIIDVVFYANSLFSSTLLEETGLIPPLVPNYPNILAVSKVTMYLALLSLPGYWLAIALIDRMGCKRLQLLGFVAIAVLYVILGASYQQLLHYPAAFVIIYGLTFFFSNFGANTTTYVLPARIYPKEVRATCHGLSSASGKLGAVVGSLVMKPLLQATNVSITLYVCAAVSMIGVLLTIFFVDADAGTVQALASIATDAEDNKRDSRSSEMSIYVD